MILAVTGGTGFVGRRLIAAGVAKGLRIRALARRPQPPEEGVTWMEGSLERTDGLARLVDGADAVIHLAGVVNAATPRGFTDANVEGTRHMVDAAASQGVRRFVHVSSLSAREPELSAYGRSKERGEAIVRASALDWTIVRPTGVYGPGDTEMRDVFRLAAHGLALLPSRGIVSLVHVDDLVRLLLVLVERHDLRATFEVDDGEPRTHAALAREIGAAVGRARLLSLTMPRALMAAAARLDRLVRGRHAKLTPDRVGYLAHADWGADPARRPPADLWRPLIATRDGLAETADWYRAQHLL